MSDLLLWVDVETTGLNPNENSLLQVAAIITDLSGRVVSEPYERVVKQWKPIAIAQANDYVKDMHTKTGLWDRLESGTIASVIDQEMLEGIKLFAPEPRSIRLAGNSVRLDLNFLESALPNTYAHLHYRSIDVSALAYALYSWGIIDAYYSKKGTHEAMSDIQESIAEYQYLMTAALNFDPLRHLTEGFHV